MPGVVVALDVLDKFIKIGNELTKLPALLLPQYRAAAISLYEICQKLLTANENIARWLYKFQYFDFSQADSQKAFRDLCRDYKTMKVGPERRALKFRCGDIDLIYRKEIESRIGGWFTGSQRADDTRLIFSQLASADGSMIEFIDSNIVSQLDAFVAEAEGLVDTNDMGAAEAARLRFKAANAEMSRRLEQFSGELSDLVLQFARIGGVPVTLGN